MRLFVIGLSLVSILAALPVAAIADDAASYGNWPQWRGPHRDGKSEETGLLKEWKTQPPKLLWMSEGLGEGFAGVSLAAGKLFTTGNLDGKQQVLCANAADGKILWKTPVSDSTPQHDYSGARCTPTVDGDHLYIVPSDGSIACLNATSGKLEWQKNFAQEWKGKMMSGWGFSESPLVDGDLVLCTPGGNDAMVVALKKSDGSLAWKCAVPKFGSRGKQGAAYSSIVISQGAGVKQYIQLVGQGLIGIRASDGKFLWGYDAIANGTANISTPLVNGDYIFCSTSYDTGAALVKLESSGDGIQATEQYFIDPKNLQNHHGGMVMVGDYVYCGNGRNNGFPTCVEWKTGKIVWGGNVRGAGSGSAAVAYADGNLIFRYDSGDVALIAASPDGYDLKGSFKAAHKQKASWAHPALAAGRMYLREQDKLMCYDLRASK